MNQIFTQYSDKFFIMFLYGILIYPNIEVKNKEHLSLELQVLKDKYLYNKLSNCSFYDMQIHYLGNIISQEEILVSNLEKIEAIRDGLHPRIFQK